MLCVLLFLSLCGNQARCLVVTDSMEKARQEMDTEWEEADQAHQSHLFVAIAPLAVNAADSGRARKKKKKKKKKKHTAVAARL